jgi:hypothetical protein
MNTLFVISAAFGDGLDDYFVQLSNRLSQGRPFALAFALFCLGTLLQTLFMRHTSLAITHQARGRA